MLGLCVAHLIVYFSIISIVSVAIGNYNVFQIPLARANSLALLVLSFVAAGWNYGNALMLSSTNQLIKCSGGWWYLRFHCR